MMKDNTLVFLFIALLVTLLLTFAITIIGPTINQMPQCQEDVVLIGQGDFENGRWDYYVCGPAVDDYIQVSP